MTKQIELTAEQQDDAITIAEDAAKLNIGTLRYGILCVRKGMEYALVRAEAQAVEPVAWVHVLKNDEHVFHGMQQLSPGKHRLYTAPQPQPQGEVVEALQKELQSVLNDWNAIVAASESPTNGGLVGHVAMLARKSKILNESIEAENAAPQQPEPSAPIDIAGKVAWHKLAAEYARGRCDGWDAGYASAKAEPSAELSDADWLSEAEIMKRAIHYCNMEPLSDFNYVAFARAIAAIAALEGKRGAK